MVWYSLILGRYIPKWGKRKSIIPSQNGSRRIKGKSCFFLEANVFMLPESALCMFLLVRNLWFRRMGLTQKSLAQQVSQHILSTFPSWMLQGPLLTLPSHSREERSENSLVYLLIRALVLLEQGFTLMTSFNLNYFFVGASPYRPQYGSVSYWGVGVASSSASTSESEEGDHNHSLHNTILQCLLYIIAFSQNPTHSEA